MQGDLPDARQWQRLNALLDEALALPPLARDAWLKRHCRAPDELRRMRALLRNAEADAPWESALSSSALWREVQQGLDVDAGNVGATREPASDRCGDWRLLRQIGQGGMADVFLAERETGGVLLRAAVKQLRPGSHQADLGSRLEREGRILARLQDERIARLLDAGVEDGQRPWLATEFIDGERIDRYCDRRVLGLEHRLGLFLEVAAAVAVAHRQLVVHRDIKPANVLVTADGRIKLLDFGIAKLLDNSQITSADPPTRAEVRVMTPDYAAPEQLLSGPIGTATDIYQLGLLLFELLARSRPFPREGFSPAEFERRIIAEPPPRPSDVVRGSDARETARLRGRLQGDLDAIVCTALEKSPDARYASVDAMISDLHRWQSGRTVRARPVGRLRRARLFVRRNLLAVSFALAVLLLLCGYAILVTMQLAASEREAMLNLSVRDYLVDIIRGADPRTVRGRGLDAQGAMLAGLEHARKQFEGQPLLLSELLAEGAEVRSGRADYDDALLLIDESIRLRRRHAAAGDPQLARSLEIRGRTLHYAARYAEAEIPLRESIAICAGNAAAGSCLALASLADVMQSRGDYAEAERLLRQELTRLPVSALVRADRQRELANVLRDAGRTAEAGTLYREALSDLSARVDPLHLSLAATRSGFARWLVEQGEFAQAGLLARQALQAQQRHFVDGHPMFGIARHVIALSLAVEGELTAANGVMDQVLEQDYLSLPSGNVLRAYALGDRGWMRLARGDSDGAERDFRAAADAFDQISSLTHPRLAEVLIGQAVLAARHGKALAADELLQSAARLRVRGMGAEHVASRAIEMWRQRLEAPAHLHPEPPAWVAPLERQRMRWAAPADTGLR